MSVLTLEAKLERTDPNTQWGFRMQGGKDFSCPLTIQRVTPGSLAAKCGLQSGDVILKIGNVETENLLHKKAQEAIQFSGNKLDLLLQRGGGVHTPTYEKFQPQPVSPVFNSFSSGQNVHSGGQNFNTAPKPFGAPLSPGSHVDNITSKTQNMSLNSNPPDFQVSAQKYSERDEPLNPAQHQSKSFKFLQGLIEAGHDEPKPTDVSEPLPPWKGGSMPPSAPTISPKNAPWQPPAPKAPPQKVPPPTATKTWAPPSSAPSASAPKLGGVAPKPTGVGAVRGKRGDAVFKQQDASGLPRQAVCSSCNNFIRGPFVLAMGKSWCPEHFLCANPQCGTKLIDIGFVEENGRLYCERDYEMYFAPRCFKCSQAVVGECVHAMQRSYHPQCFLCFRCKKPIGGNQFHIEDGNPYCEADWAAEFQTMCAGCNYPIEPGDKWVEAMSKNYHSECFNCSTCQVSLEGVPFFIKAGKQYCKKHAR